MSARIIVVTGVSGSGKSTIGALLARRLNARFIEGDEYHSPANVDKMRQGIALQDDDRWPWLDRLNRELRTAAAYNEDAVLACSALRRAYRDRLTRGVGVPVHFVLLNGSPTLIAERMSERNHRYMPVSLLASQFDTLEMPAAGEAIVVDVGGSVEDTVQAILRDLAPP
jgi:gluconokinase